MNKVVKIILSVISSIIIFVVAVPIVLGILLQIGIIQNFVVDRLTEYLSRRAGTTISIDRVSIGFFNKAVINGLYVEDLRGDTLIFAEQLKVGVKAINFTGGPISLNNVTLSDGKIYLHRDSSGVMNVTRVLNNFRRAEPSRSRNDFRLDVDELSLINVRFKLFDELGEKRDHGVNFKDLELNEIYFQGRTISVFNDDIKLSLQHLSFKEKSGFNLKHLISTWTEINSTGFRFNDLKIEDDLSALDFKYLYLLYDDWSGLSDFTNKVVLDAVINPSQLSFSTIAAFGRKPSRIRTSFDLSGEIQGPIADLRGKLNKIHSRNTYLDLGFHIKGLPEIEKSVFDITINHLITDGPDITAIYADITGKTIENISPILARAGALSFNGSFQGMVDNFKAAGHLNTYRGPVAADLQFMPDRGGGIRFIGHMSTDGFMLGELLGEPRLGRIVMNANVDATVLQRSLNLMTNAEIREITFGGYRYENISINGSIADNTFEGTIKINDRNLEMVTTGNFDFAREVPAYNFDMELTRADLFGLGIDKRDSVAVVSGQLKAYATGSNIDNINGLIQISDLTYKSSSDTVYADTISFVARNDEFAKKISITSEFADIELQGKNSYRNIFPFLKQSLASYIPSIPDVEEITGVKQPSAAVEIKEDSTFEDGYYMLTVKIKKTNNVAAIFLPGLEVAEGTSVKFFFNPYRNQFDFNLKSDYIENKSLYLEDLNIDSRNYTDSLAMYLSAELFSVGRTELRNFSIIGGIRNNRISLASRFLNPEDSTQGRISTTSTFRRTISGMPQLDIMFHPTSFVFDSQPWLINESHILLDTTGITIKGMRISSTEKELYVNGKVGRTVSDTLSMDIKNIDISPASGLVKSMGYKLDGEATGTIKGISLLKNMQLFAMINFKDLQVNGYPIGSPVLSTKLENDLTRTIKLQIVNDAGEIPITGYFNSDSKQFNVDILFPKFNMVLLDPLFAGSLANSAGEADVRLNLSGTPATPTLNGSIDIKKYEVTVDFTQVRYSTSGKVNVVNNRFSIENAPLSDLNGGTGTLSAFFDSRYFKNMSLGVNAQFTDMLCLNTTAEDNDYFHGRAYGTGNFTIDGRFPDIKMVIRAETARNSSFILPLSGASTIEEDNMIRFIDPNDWIREEEQKPQSTRRKQERQQVRRDARRAREQSNMDIDIGLRVLPNTEAQIILDPLTGSMLRGRGEGNFNMRIIPSQDIFTMSGLFTIQQGSYRFVQSIIDKMFTIERGGTIRWTGDPTNPDVNLDVTYRVKTSLRPLTQGFSGSSNSTEVICGINLTGKLLHPKILLSVRAPNTDPETQNILRNLLNTEEAVSMQFISLLATGSFMPDMGAAAIGNMGGSFASATGFEFLSNQISDMISSDTYNLRLGFRPGDRQTSADEFNIDFGTDIIRDRLILELEGNYRTGNIGMYNQRTPFTGDANLTWVLNKTGNLRLRGFTRVIDRFDETQGLQESGIGLYFRQDFHNLADLVYRYHRSLQRARQNRADRRMRREAARESVNAAKADTTESANPVVPEPETTDEPDLTHPTDNNLNSDTAPLDKNH